MHHASTHALTLLVLDLLLHVLNGIRGLHLEGDGLASEGLDKDLHASTQAQHQVECGLLLDVVVGQGAAVLQLLSGEDEALLVWGDACEKPGANNVYMSPPKVNMQPKSGHTT
jgi:hypothetical protein